MADQYGSGSTSPLSHRQPNALSRDNSTTTGPGEADERSPLLTNAGRSRVRIQGGGTSPAGRAPLSRNQSYSGGKSSRGGVHNPCSQKTS